MIGALSSLANGVVDPIPVKRSDGWFLLFFSGGLFFVLLVLISYFLPSERLFPTNVVCT